MGKDAKNPEWVLEGDRLRQVREALGLSQEELADAAGLGRTSIDNYENGARQIKSLTLRKIRRAFLDTPQELPHLYEWVFEGSKGRFSGEFLERMQKVAAASPPAVGTGSIKRSSARRAKQKAAK